jgi:hypothetical protein
MASAKETAAGIIGVSVLAKSPRARRALVGLLRQGGRTMGPWGLAAWLAYEGYVRRDQIRSVANEIAERLPPAVPGQGGDPTFGRVTPMFDDASGFVDAGPSLSQRLERGVQKFQSRRGVKPRKPSKHQKAVGKAYRAIKKQAGKTLPSRAFKQATKIASRANPATKSKIGKGKSFAQRTARKIRKSVWGTLRRKK